MTKITLFLVALLTFAAAAWAAGGKNRLSDWRTDIVEMYLLCEQQGVRSVTLEEDGVVVVLDCPPGQAEF